MRFAIKKNHKKINSSITKENKTKKKKNKGRGKTIGVVRQVPSGHPPWLQHPCLALALLAKTQWDRGDTVLPPTPKQERTTLVLLLDGGKKKKKRKRYQKKK